jgi:hypothetical protein
MEGYLQGLIEREVWLRALPVQAQVLPQAAEETRMA